MRIWCQTLCYHLEPVVRSWKARNIGAYVGGQFVPIVGYADDITLLSNDYAQLLEMTQDIIRACGKLGLTLSQDDGK
eukprot:8211106-Karenia_brevis.AAC.1